MFQSRSTPFEEDVEKATSENNLSEDWSQIMLICDNAVNYQDGAKFCLKAIMKRLSHTVPRVVMQALVLLDSCVKNCDKRFLLQVASSEFTTEARKLLGKMHPSCSIKLKELLQKWSLEEFKDDPELCIIPSLYYKLKSEGVEFPPLEKEKKIAAPICNDPNAVTSQEEENDIIKAIEISLKDTGRYSAPIDEATSRLSLTQTQEKQKREPFKVLALYDFEAAEDNELTLKAGELIIVTDDSDSNWWRGKNQTNEGLFPSNFVSEDEYLKSLEPKIEATSVIETEDTTNNIVAINEKKIDQVLNWLNDVDPTEELTDPEDMIKLEKECYKMGPLIEENLHAIDNRMATLEATNVKIIEAFDLFHELSTVSNQWATLPSNIKSYSSAIQVPYTQHTLPHSMPAQNNISSQKQVSGSISSEAADNQQSAKTNNIHQNQVMTLPISSQSVQDSQVVLPTTLNTIASINLPINQGLPTTGVLNPYVFVPPGMPYALQNQVVNLPGGSQVVEDSQVVPPTTSFTTFSSIKQGFPTAGVLNPYTFVPPGIPPVFPPNHPPSYLPFPGSSQTYAGMPYTVPQMGHHVPYPYYYVNNTQPTIPVQNNSIAPSISQPQDVISNNAIPVSNVSSSTSSMPVNTSNYFSELQQMTAVDSTSVLTPSSTKDEAMQAPSAQASGDGQLSNNSSSGESS